jgi:hypothetical protein
VGGWVVGGVRRVGGVEGSRIIDSNWSRSCTGLDRVGVVGGGGGECKSGDFLLPLVQDGLCGLGWGWGWLRLRTPWVWSVSQAKCDIVCVCLTVLLRPFYYPSSLSCCVFGRDLAVYASHALLIACVCFSPACLPW